MSPLISRILMTILLFPSATLFMILSFFILARLMGPDDEVAIVAGTLLTCGYIVGYWLLLWRRDVKWAAGRVRTTLTAAVAAGGAGVVVGLMVSAAVRYDDGTLGMILGSLTGTLLWVMATILLWRETPDERSARLARAGADTLVCPSCGYNLTGLREARCPECGAAFTLNDLLASQPGREQVEIERA